MNKISVTDLPNIGPTLGRRLASLGIVTRDQLAAAGPAQVYRKLCEMTGRRLPVCYNLYSLEAALRGQDWRRLDDDEKRRLRRAAGEECP